MKFQALFFLLLLACLYLSVAQGSYGNCCLGHVKGMKKNVKRNVERYSVQETDGDCNIRAIVFQMRKRADREQPRRICADPNDAWVKDLKKILDARNTI